MTQRSDTERLEWLEKTVLITPLIRTWTGFAFSRDYKVEHEAKTVREAIDAAMDAEERG